MSNMSNESDLTAKLAEQLAAHLRRNMSPPSQPGPTSMFGMPSVQQAAPFGLPAQAPMGPMPQPTGVSVPVTVPLPDGRELSVRIHFGSEAVGNLQGLAAACAAMFGPYLQARAPYHAGWGGYGGYGRAFNGRYGRR